MVGKNDVMIRFLLMFPMFSGPLLELNLSLFSDVPFVKDKYSNMWDDDLSGEREGKSVDS